MQLRSLLAEATKRELALSRPSSLKHWWKCDEATGATTLVDTIGGANIPIAAITASNGVITTVPNVVNATGIAADLTDIGTNDFMFLFQGQVTNLGSISLGDTAATYVNQVGSIVTNSSIKGAGGTSTTGGTDDSLGAWALVRNSNDSGNIDTYDNGAATAPSDADSSGSVTLGAKASMTGVSNLAGIFLFVFDGNLPADFAEASAFMGSQHALNNKVLYPSPLAEWGTWA